VSAVIGHIVSSPTDYIISDANNLTVPLLQILNPFNFEGKIFCSGLYLKQISIKYLY